MVIKQLYQNISDRVGILNDCRGPEAVNRFEEFSDKDCVVYAHLFDIGLQNFKPCCPAIPCIGRRTIPEDV